MFVVTQKRSDCHEHQHQNIRVNCLIFSKNLRRTKNKKVKDKYFNSQRLLIYTERFPNYIISFQVSIVSINFSNQYNNTSPIQLLNGVLIPLILTGHYVKDFDYFQPNYFSFISHPILLGYIIHTPHLESTYCKPIFITLFLNITS